MNLTADLLNKRGRHPDLGVVTLRQLLSTWVVHDLGHIRQVVRVMSKQYREAGSEGSVEQRCEPMNKNRIGGIRRRASWQSTGKAHIHQGRRL
jgi:hypothetical protein